MKRKVGVLLVLVVAAVSGWWCWWRVAAEAGQRSADPQVAAAQQARDEVIEQAQKEPDQFPAEESLRALRDHVRQMSDEQRRAFFESSRPMFMKMMESRIERFFALSPEQQTKQLDKHIDRMQSARREGGPPFGRGGDRQSTSGGTEGKKENFSPRGPRGWGSLTPEERNEKRKEMLSHTSPQGRAMFTEYRARLQQRMKQRGITPPPWMR